MTSNIEHIRSSIIAVCDEHAKAREVLKKANGKRTYGEIADLLRLHKTTCSTILNKANNLGLMDKNGPGIFKRKKAITVAIIDKALKYHKKADLIEQTRKVKRRPKKTNPDGVKKDIRKYILGNFKTIHNPFDKSKSISLTEAQLDDACDKLFEYVDKHVGIDQLDGLSTRFYDSFASFFSAHRIDKPEMLNAFSGMVKNFEPYIKKVAVIKKSDNSLANPSLSRDLIRNTVSFSSNLKNPKDEYWADKPVHESVIRMVYPFRHKEAHESRDYTVYEMEKIIFCLIASLIFINLNY